MNNMGIDEKKAIERAKYWEEYIKEHPLEEDEEILEEEWNAYEDYVIETEKEEVRDKEDFVSIIKKAREQHRLNVGDQE